MSSALNNSGNESTPNNNKLLMDWYDKFRRETPYVTRFGIHLGVTCYAVSWIFLDLQLYYALACIPHFVVGSSHYYEIYRIFTSLLVSIDSFVSVIWACLLWYRSGTIVEEAVGSTRLVYYSVVLFTVISNMLFLFVCWIMAVLSSSSSDETSNRSSAAYSWMLMQSAAGIWGIVLGVLAIDCCRDTTANTRKLLFWNVPTLYYPIVIFFLVSVLLSGHVLSHGISLALGYAVGSKYPAWEFLPLTLPTRYVTVWEESGNMLVHSRFLSPSPSHHRGWIVLPAALGSAAWSSSNRSRNGNDNDDRQSLLSSFLSQRQTAGREQEMSAATTSAGGGRTLGGGAATSANNPRRHVDARAARLQALDHTSSNV